MCIHIYTHTYIKKKNPRINFFSQPEEKQCYCFRPTVNVPLLIFVPAKIIRKKTKTIKQKKSLLNFRNGFRTV